MQKGDQSEDDPRDEEERLLMRHRDLPSLLRFKPCEEHRQQVHRTGLTSEPLIAPLLPFPEGAKRAVFAQREILTLLMRAAHVSIAHCDGRDSMCVEELHDLSLDLWVRRYVGSDPSLDDRLGILCREHTCGDLGRGLVVGTVKGHGARRVRYRFLSL